MSGTTHSGRMVSQLGGGVAIITVFVNAQPFLFNGMCFRDVGNWQIYRIRSRHIRIDLSHVFH